MKIMVLELAGPAGANTAQPAWTRAAVSSRPGNLAVIFLPQASGPATRNTAGFIPAINSKIPKKQSAVKHRVRKNAVEEILTPLCGP